MEFDPDYTNIVTAAQNKKARRLPLYEHNIAANVVEEVIGKKLPDLFGTYSDIKEYFRLYSLFCKDHGYDVVPFEGCITEIVQGGEALCGRTGSIIRDFNDLEQYPWQKKVEEYFERFDMRFQALSETMPPGMKAVGGVGNGVFEVVQDFVPLTELAFLQIDDPELYAALWVRVGKLIAEIWERFLEKYCESYAVCRFGDDLGFATSTLINPREISEHIVPIYSEIVESIHRYKKPFLLHSCGAIFPVMKELISTVQIDAKHSNEDNIAPFTKWTELYKEEIGLFGGIDMNVLCLNTKEEIKEYVTSVLNRTADLPGIAIGSGNQIADYVPPEGFLAMVETVRIFRGE